MNKKNPTSPKKAQASLISRHIPKKIYIPTIFIVAYVFSLYVPIVSLYSRYPLYAIQCGRLPIVASGYSEVYKEPGDVDYAVHPFIKDFFCTSQEAEAAGYHSNR